MDNSLLNPEIQGFIKENIGANVQALALKKNPFPTVDWPEVLNQIVARSKAKDKLPTWFGSHPILYPAKVSVEQASSEVAAAYKANLVSGEELIDLSGGFGVDDFYFAKKITHVTHCELNENLSKLVAHNFEVLGAKNISCVCTDSTDFLRESSATYDWIYVDPSRRHDVKGKVFLLADCSPNVPELLDFYFEKAPNILVKAAPLLDLTSALRELPHTRTVHVVAVAHEVKELLFELQRGYTGPIGVRTVDLAKNNTQAFDFEWGQMYPSQLGTPKKYLYEPNAAILKSGAFEAVGDRFGLEKLHRHTHLYTSDALVEFPGRVFEIQSVLAYDKKNMKAYLEGQQCNLSTRNFPESPENLRRKWKLRDGGERYVFFTTDCNETKIVVICAKIPQP